MKALIDKLKSKYVFTEVGSHRLESILIDNEGLTDISEDFYKEFTKNDYHGTEWKRYDDLALDLLKYRSAITSKSLYQYPDGTPLPTETVTEIDSETKEKVSKVLEVDPDYVRITEYIDTSDDTKVLVINFETQEVIVLASEGMLDKLKGLYDNAYPKATGVEPKTKK